MGHAHVFQLISKKHKFRNVKPAIIVAYLVLVMPSYAQLVQLRLLLSDFRMFLPKNAAAKKDILMQELQYVRCVIFLVRVVITLKLVKHVPLLRSKIIERPIQVSPRNALV